MPHDEHTFAAEDDKAVYMPLSAKRTDPTVPKVRYSEVAVQYKEGINVHQRYW
jgi:hypothetical protein